MHILQNRTKPDKNFWGVTQTSSLILDQYALI